MTLNNEIEKKVMCQFCKNWFESVAKDLRFEKWHGFMKEISWSFYCFFFTKNGAVQGK